MSADEIAQLWCALDDPATPNSLLIRLALKLQLVTAHRKGEVIDAEWHEFDPAEGVWTIPREKAKNGMTCSTFGVNGSRKPSVPTLRLCTVSFG